ncbi:STAS domain-containing protein [Streptomyces roseolus]|uniref:STAS domain-containing protein n=1 Tax=Streptomyces roseolus TaxID=67358 RepID=UPI00379C9ABE
MTPMSPVERVRHRSLMLLRRLRPHREHVVVRFRGDLTADTIVDTHRVLRTALRDVPEVLVVDLSRVTHLSPDGAVVLLLAVRAARAQKTRLEITGARAQTAVVIRQTGLERYLSHGPLDR